MLPTRVFKLRNGLTVVVQTDKSAPLVAVSLTYRVGSLDEDRGRGGFAHVAFRVVDIQKAFDYMKNNGFKIIDAHPRNGSRGTQVFFVHPKTTEQAAFGYLMEVVQEGVAHA